MTQLSPILDQFGSPITRVENSSLRDPDDWFFDGLGARPTAAGERVTVATAILVETVFACCRNISDDEAKLPLILYERSKKDPRYKSPALDDPLYSILCHQPNEEMSSMSFRRKLTIDACLQGDGYAEIVFRGPNVQEMWPLEHDYVSPRRLANGKLVYEVRNDRTGEPDILQPRQIFHLKGPTPDGIKGFRMTHLARETIGTALAMEHYSGAEIGNDATPCGILTMDGKLGDDARKKLREQWAAVHAGGRNARRPAVLEDGLKFVPIAIPQRDQQFLERVQHVVEQICRWYRMPPHKVGHLLRSTFSNIDAQNVEYLTDCLMTWLVAWEQEIQLKLIPRNRTDLFAKHDYRAFLRGDMAAMNTFATTFVGNSIGTPNEAREFFDLNPIENPAADMLYRNIATVPLDTPVADPNAPKVDDSASEPDADDAPEGNKRPKQKDDPPQKDRVKDRLVRIVEAHKPVFENCLRKILGTHRDKVKRAFKGDDRPEAIRKLNEFFDDQSAFLMRELGPAVSSLAESLWYVSGAEVLPECVILMVSAGVSVVLDAQVARSRREMIIPEAVELWEGSRPHEDAQQICRAVFQAVVPSPCAVGPYALESEPKQEGAVCAIGDQ